MNYYYLYIIIEGINSLLEVHYELYADNNVNVYNWFDQHGDSPDLSDQQIHNIAHEIRQFESQRPLGVPGQQRLSLEFNGLAA